MRGQAADWCWSTVQAGHRYRAATVLSHGFSASLAGRADVPRCHVFSQALETPLSAVLGECYLLLRQHQLAGKRAWLQPGLLCPVSDAHGRERSPLVLAVGREASFLLSVGAQGGSLRSSSHHRPPRTFWLGPGNLVATHEAGPMELGTA